MTKKTKWILISASALLLVLIILAKVGAFGKSEGLKVTAEKAKQRTIIEVVNASGKVYPEVEVKVSPDISGEITELTVKEGDTVKRGQLLARIYADVYNIQKNQAASGVAQSQAQVNIQQAQVNNSRAQVDNSRAASEAVKSQLDQAERSYNMQKQLFNDKVISQSEFNVADAAYRTAQANYNAAMQGIKSAQASVQSAQAGVQSAQAGVQTSQANLQRASKDLGRTSIIAPSDGVVSLLNVKLGEKVAGNSFNVGTEMLRIADMDKIEIRVDVGENDVPKVKLGDSALVSVDAYSNRKFKGLVTQIASSNNGASNQLGGATNDVTQYKVYIRILKESYADLLGKGNFPFRPGMSANTDIQTRRVVNVISVPLNAVTTRDKSDSTKTGKEKNTEEENNTPNPSGNDDDIEVLVFVKDSSNKVKKYPVKTGIQDNYYIEITEGLKGGEEVITGPYDVVSKLLTVDKKVKVVDKKELYEKKD
jgi:HlyD family secretion protein